MCLFIRILHRKVGYCTWKVFSCSKREIASGKKLFLCLDVLVVPVI